MSRPRRNLYRRLANNDDSQDLFQRLIAERMAPLIDEIRDADRTADDGTIARRVIEAIPDMQEFMRPVIEQLAAEMIGARPDLSKDQLVASIKRMLLKDQS